MDDLSVRDNKVVLGLGKGFCDVRFTWLGNLVLGIWSRLGLGTGFRDMRFALLGNLVLGIWSELGLEGGFCWVKG